MPKSRLARRLLTAILILTGLCLASLLASFISNRFIPTASSLTDRLAELEKARLAEALHLRAALGDRVWPGWAAAEIPLTVYNEAYAFLVNYPAPPPAGWRTVPGGQAYGGAWEVVPGDAYNNQPYYRLRLPDPKTNPQAFIVQIGDRYIASLPTKEYSAISFFQGFQETVPAGLRPIFPYRLVWNMLMGETEDYLGALNHEAFHAFQATTAFERLSAGEASFSADGQYPYQNPAIAAAWQSELDLLVQAVRATDPISTTQLTQHFLLKRAERRRLPGMQERFILEERAREWEEGLAKYAELEILRQAALASDYQPVSQITADPDFHGYRNRLKTWDQQVAEVANLSMRSNETRYYYSGFAQAVLLDRLLPGWKGRAFQPGAWLEDLLEEAITG